MADWQVVSQEPTKDTGKPEPDAWSIVEQTPTYRGSPGVRAALADLVKLRAKYPETKPGFTQTLADAASLGLSSQVNAGVSALMSPKKGYTARDMYDATRLLDSAQRKTFAAKHPVANIGANLAGAAVMPGAEQLGKFIVGKVAPGLAKVGASVPLSERALQTVRASGTAGALGATQGALTAAPGEEGSEATRAGVTSAIAAPIVGTAASGSVKAAVGLRNLAQNAEQKAARKLVDTLRTAGLAPDDLRAAFDEWRQTGGAPPALVDVLHKAGAGDSVFKLLAASQPSAAVNRAARSYMTKVAGGVQDKALAETRTLPGDARTPVEIRADLAADHAEVADRIAQARSKADADLEAGRREPPPGVAPGEGAAVFHEALNKAHDASKKAYQDLYDAIPNEVLDAAKVDPEAVTDLFKHLTASLGYKPNTKFDATAAKIAEYVKQAQGDGKNVSVLDLKQLRDGVDKLIQDYPSKESDKMGIGLKRAIDESLHNLVNADMITGKPEVVGAIGEANTAFGAHQDKFGKGLIGKLTERQVGKPEETVVPAEGAGDVIFGSEKIGRRQLDKTADALGPALDLVPPEAADALRTEAYSRVKPEHLADLSATRGGKALLHPDLTQQSIEAQRATAEAEQAHKDAMSALDEQEAQAAQPTPRETALATGESALKAPSEEFTPAMEAVPEALRPVAQSGVRQALADRLERPAPQSEAALNALGSAQVRQNLGTATLPALAERYQARLKNIGTQAETAQRLAAASGADTSGFDKGVVDVLQSRDLVSPALGASHLSIWLARHLGKLHPAEQMAVLNQLTSYDPQAVEDLAVSLPRKYGIARRGITPQVVGHLNATAGDSDALDRLREEYGLN